MKKLSLLTLVVALAVSGTSVRAQNTEEIQHAPDGSTRQILQSITIPALPHAPFLATVSTEWVQKMEDGSATTIRNYRTVARDSSGRIFEERRTFVPKTSTEEPRLRQLEYSDPVKHVRYVCNPYMQTCELFTYNERAVAATKEISRAGKRQTENLGKDTISGLEVVGQRETLSIDPSTVGNDSQLLVTKEFWYSPQLGINLLTKRSDPRFGVQTFQVSEINTSEPDSKYFSIPSNFQVIDHRLATMRAFRNRSSK